MVCLQSSIVHFWRTSHFIPCEIGLYDGILEFGKTHFSLERVVILLFFTCPLLNSKRKEMAEKPVDVAQ